MNNTSLEASMVTEIKNTKNNLLKLYKSVNSDCLFIDTKRCDKCTPYFPVGICAPMQPIGSCTICGVEYFSQCKLKSK